MGARAIRVGLGVLLSTTLLSPALAQTAARPAAAPAAGAPRSAEQVLLDRARFESARGRTTEAAAALNQLLQSAPTHAEGLYEMGLLEARTGNVAAAQRYLDRLRAAHPDQTARIGQLERAIRSGQVNRAAVEEARRLAQGGSSEQAVRRYREAFRGNEPAGQYTREYYETLAGTPAGIDEARQGLEELVKSSGGDVRNRLALAKVLTYRESTRRRGIADLATLSQTPAVANEATAAWRQALLWLGADPRDRALFDAYLTRHPNDSEVRNKRERAHSVAQASRPTGPDRATRERIEGFAELNRGDLEGAESSFRQTLASRPSDADALAGLGIVRLRQERFAEARDLLSRAVGNSSARRRQYGEAYDAATFWAGMNDAQAAYDAGRTADARRILEDLMRRGHRERAAARRLMGDIALRERNAALAEQEYRAALRSEPNSVAASIGLFNALVAQNRQDEALRVAQGIENRRGQIANYEQVESEVERLKARQFEMVGEDDAAFRSFQQAIVADPSNPWLRLDFARFLDTRGERDQADAMIRNMAETPQAAPAALHAAAVFYNERRQYREAIDALDRIAPTQQTPAMRELRDQIYVTAEVERAKALAEAGQRGEAVRILESLQRSGPRSAERTGLIANTLAEIGQTRRAQALVGRQVTGRNTPPDVLINYVGVLLKSGQEAEASAFLRQLDETRNLTPDQRRQVADLKAGFAVIQSDRLRAAQRYADAYDVLYPHLAEQPNDPALLMALARLYGDAGSPDEALGIYAAVLDRNPQDIDAVRGAVGTAIQAKNYDYASELLEQALVYHPRDARVYFLMGEVARAQGDNATARRALETAQSLRQGELASASAAVDRTPSALPENPFRNRGQTARRPVAPVPPAPSMLGRGENPFRSGAGLSRPTGALAQAPAIDIAMDDRSYVPARPAAQLAQATDVYYRPPFIPPVATAPRREPDTLSRDIERSLAEVRRETGTTVEAGLKLRGRDGDSGLDRLTEFTAPMKVTFSPWDLAGVTLQATPTTVDAGSLGNSIGDQRRFGTNPLGPAVDPGKQNDTGVGLSAAVATRIGLSADIGTTPIGFHERTWVGGVSFAPKIDDKLTIKGTVERRAVTDSVLSYAGTEDARTGQSWGGVHRQGVRLDAGFDDGAFGAYVGGGFYDLDGNNTADNDMTEMTVGGYYRVINKPDEELKVGVNLTYFTYDENLRYFTLGHGGYFSPQNYYSFSIPVEYSRREGKLRWLVGGAIGVQNFEEDDAPIFPNDPGLQAGVEAAAAADPSIDTAYNGQNKTNLGFNLRGQVEYDVTPATAVGAAATFDNAADWFEASGLVYVRHTLGNGWW